MQAAQALVVGANLTLQRSRFVSPAMVAKKVAVKKDIDMCAAARHHCCLMGPHRAASAGTTVRAEGAWG